MFLFLYLKAFGGTGGIEKFNRAMLKALDILSRESAEDIYIYSAYDGQIQPAYYSGKHYKGFSTHRIWFTLYSLWKGLQADRLLLGHINLALIAFVLKMFRPGLKVVLVTHGIEVWGNVSRLQKSVLNSADEILSVSNYTRDILISKHNIRAEKIRIFHNTLDPYFNPLVSSGDVIRLKERLEIPAEARVLLTIARLKTTELQKGYDKVLSVLSSLVKSGKDVYYVLGGKYAPEEYTRIKMLAEELGIANRLILPGYIQDKEMPLYYHMADVFTMPSKKEGFGIVFIEAMSCGTPVVAGNKDGSRDALIRSELGSLVDPDNIEEITLAVQQHLDSGKTQNAEAVLAIQETFGFNQFCKNVKTI